MIISALNSYVIFFGTCTYDILIHDHINIIIFCYVGLNENATF